MTKFPRLRREIEDFLNRDLGEEQKQAEYFINEILPTLYPSINITDPAQFARILEVCWDRILKIREVVLEREALLKRRAEIARKLRACETEMRQQAIPLGLKGEDLSAGLILLEQWKRLREPPKKPGRPLTRIPKLNL